MNIAVIGSGNVGGTLGRRWAEAGHQVTFGARNPDNPKLQAVLAQTNHQARGASIPEAIANAEIVVLTTPYEAAKEVLQPASSLAGKIVLDCTNPIAPGLKGLTVGLNTSGAEELARLIPETPVVKSFNTTGWENMANPHYGDQKATMFLCGDNPEARQKVIQLIEVLGFEASDTGGLHMARYLEPLAMVWIHLARVQGHGADIALKLLKR